MTSDARGGLTHGRECVPNIGPAERKKRLRFGAQMTAASALLAVGLFVLAPPRPWRLVLLLPLWAAAIGFFQASERTCVRLAAHNVRNMDTGEEAVTDAAELAQIRRQARRVFIEAFAVAAPIAVLLAWIPI
jgi:hypothetical protein